MPKFSPARILFASRTLGVAHDKCGISGEVPIPDAANSLSFVSDKCYTLIELSLIL